MRLDALMKTSLRVPYLCFATSMHALQPTKVTEAGLRVALTRMMGAPKRNNRLFLFREDGRMIEVKLIDTGTVSQSPSTSEPQPLYELVARWYETTMGEGETMLDDADSKFVPAMTRFFGVPNPCLTVEIMRPDLTSFFKSQDSVPKCVDMLQRLLTLKLCECGINMIGDDECVCLTCAVGLEDKDIAKHMCGVCHDVCIKTIVTTECCGQWIHDVCRRKCWLRCPFCRAPFHGDRT